MIETQRRLTRSEAGKLGYLASKATHERIKKEKLASYFNNPTKCKNCGKVLPYEKRHNTFCDKSCAACYNNKGIARNGKPHRTVKCLNCGKEIKSRKYCSTKCQQTYQTEQRIKNGTASYRCIGKYLINKYGNKCMICGISEWLGKPIMLITDHINGNHFDDRFENLRVICSNCDATLPTYKRRNGRKYKKSAGIA